MPKEKIKAKQKNRRPWRYVWLLILLSLLSIPIALLSIGSTQPQVMPTLVQLPTVTPYNTAPALIDTIKLSSQVRAIEKSPIDNRIALLLGDRILIADTHMNRIVFVEELKTQHQTTFNGQMTGLVFNEDGTTVMTSAILKGGDVVILQWDVITGEELPYFIVEDNEREPTPPWTIWYFRANGKQAGLITTNLDNDSRRTSKLYRLDLQSGKLIELVYPEGDQQTRMMTKPTDIAFADNSFAVQLFTNPASRYNGGRIIKQTNNQAPLTLMTSGHDAGLQNMLLSPDGRYLAGTSYTYRQPTDDNPDYRLDYLHIWHDDYLFYTRDLPTPALEMVFTSDNHYLFWVSRSHTGTQDNPNLEIDNIYIEILDNRHDQVARFIEVPTRMIDKKVPGSYQPRRSSTYFLMLSHDNRELYLIVDDMLFRWDIHILFN